MKRRSTTIEPADRDSLFTPDLDRAEIARRFGRHAAYRDESESDVAFWLRLLGLALIAALFVLLAGYTLAETTSRAAARRILGAAIVQVTDFDQTLAAHLADMQAATSSPSAASGIALPGYPIDARLKPQEIQGQQAGRVRALLLERSADVLYDRGISAFHTSNGKSVRFGSAAPLSAPWLFAQGLHVVNARFHARVLQVTKIAMIAAAMLGIVLFVLSRGYNRTVMYGVALLVAALPVLALALLLWLLLIVFLGASSDPLVAGTQQLLRDVVWFVVLSYALYSAVALALIGTGLLFERLGDSLAARADPATHR
jgi:hypothetical protein